MAVTVSSVADFLFKRAAVMSLIMLMRQKIKDKNSNVKVKSLLKVSKTYLKELFFFNCSKVIFTVVFCQMRLINMQTFLFSGSRLVRVDFFSLRHFRFFAPFLQPAF